MDSNGTNIVQLTDNNYSDKSPSFSPDGDTIAFSSYLDGDYEIFTMDTDGNNTIQLTDNESDDYIIRGGWK